MDNNEFPGKEVIFKKSEKSSDLENHTFTMISMCSEKEKLSVSSEKEKLSVSEKEKLSVSSEKQKLSVSSEKEKLSVSSEKKKIVFVKKVNDSKKLGRKNEKISKKYR